MWPFQSQSAPFNPNFGTWRTEPWLHSVSEQTHDVKTYRRLRDYFPPPEWTGSRKSKLLHGLGNQDFRWEDFIRIATPWSEYYEYLSGVRFYDRLMRHIGPTLEQQYPDLCFSFNCLVRPDLYFFRFYPGLSLDLHLDSAMHIMSWVTYFDTPEGGEFVLGDNENPLYYKVHENMSLMWLNDGYSWHGVRPIKSTRCMVYTALNHKDLVWDETRPKYAGRPALPPLSDFPVIEPYNVAPVPQTG